MNENNLALSVVAHSCWIFMTYCNGLNGRLFVRRLISVRTQKSVRFQYQSNSESYTHRRSVCVHWGIAVCGRIKASLTRPPFILHYKMDIVALKDQYSFVKRAGIIFTPFSTTGSILSIVRLTFAPGPWPPGPVSRMSHRDLRSNGLSTGVHFDCSSYSLSVQRRTDAAAPNAAKEHRLLLLLMQPGCGGGGCGYLTNGLWSCQAHRGRATAMPQKEEEKSEEVLHARTWRRTTI